MRPISRFRPSKTASVRKFKRTASRTKKLNLRLTPMRGGWRL